jgi:hypothetical protein
MELTKKTTILFSPDLHGHLTQLASERGTSLGALVREACEAQYLRVNSQEKLKAVETLRSLSLPVSSPGRMKRQSVMNFRPNR